MQPYNPVIPGCTFPQDYLMVAWHVSTKMVGKQRVSVVNTLLLSPTALVVAFQWCAFNLMIQSFWKRYLRELNVIRIQVGYPTLKRSHGKI